MIHTEENTQMMCVRWFSLQHRQLAPLLHHSPNGGRRDAREGARFKAMGTKAGFPDLFLAYPCGGYHGLFIEMKAEKGRLSANQVGMTELLATQGYKVAICRNFDQFVVIIEEYLRNEKDITP